MSSQKEKRARKLHSSQHIDQNDAGQPASGLRFMTSLLSVDSGESKQKESSLGGTSLLYGLESRLRGQEITDNV